MRKQFFLASLGRLLAGIAIAAILVSQIIDDPLSAALAADARKPATALAAAVVPGAAIAPATASSAAPGAATDPATAPPSADATSSTGETAATASVPPVGETQTDEKKPPDLTVDDVKIEGNRLIPTDDIMHVVKTRPGDKYNRDQVQQDLKAINSLGYFDDSRLQALPELNPSGVLLKIHVEENAPVSQFSFEGNKVLSSEDINKAFCDQLGKPQNLNQLSSAIEKVEQAYHQRGFVLARVTDVKDDKDGSISLTINEGELDSIQIVGNRKTKDFIIRHAIKLKPGAVYNERQLTNDLRKLFANGYFSDIRRSLAPSAQDANKYTLKVEVDEKRSGSVSLGGGVDTIAGPFGSFGFSDANFRGRGEVLSFTSQVGTGLLSSLSNSLNNAGQQFVAAGRTYNVDATFIEPHLNGSDTSMSISAFGRNFNSMMIDLSQQRTIGTSITFTRPLVDHFSASLGVSGEDTTLKDVSTLFSGATLLNQMATRALTLGLANNATSAQAFAANVRNQELKGGLFLSVNPGISYDTRDRAVDPTKGTYARLSASPSLGIDGTSFAKLGVNLSHYIPLTKETTFATNLQAGTSFGGVPGFAQYQLGGFNGIRGYRQFSDLGTGSSMLMASAELRHRLPLPRTENKIVKAIDKHVKVALFADAGEVGGNSVYNSLLSRGATGAAIGIGLRINVPMVGTIRLDVGLPLISTVLGSRVPRFTFGFGDKF